MRRLSWNGGLVLVLALGLIVPPAWAGPGNLPGVPPAGLPVRQDGQSYCFLQTVPFGNLKIAGGQCYTTYLVRTSSGFFLGFGPPGPPMVPPGQIVRMSTPAGAKTKGRLFYLLPLGMRVPDFPVDAIRHVAVQFLMQGGALVISVPVTDARVALLRSGEVLPQEHR